MNYAAAEAALTDDLHTSWANGRTPTPIVGDNQTFDPADPASTAPFPANGPWVQMAINWSSESQINLAPVGARGFRAHGRLSIRCLAPENQGRALAIGMADQMANLYRARQIAVRTAGQVKTHGLRIESDGGSHRFLSGYWSTLVSVDLTYDDIA